VLLLCAVLTAAASAQIYSVVAESVTDGFLTLGLDGNFYATDYNGGGAGSVFRLTPSGVVTTIYSFPGQPYESARRRGSCRARMGTFVEPSGTATGFRQG